MNRIVKWFSMFMSKQKSHPQISNKRKLYSSNSITERRIINEIEKLHNEKNWIELRKHIDYIKEIYPNIKIKNIDVLRNEALTNITKLSSV